MSLNLYAGSLHRFYSRNFERPLERFAHENRIGYGLVLPSSYSTPLSNEEIKKQIAENKLFLSEKAPFISDWDDEFQAYHTEELTYDGHSTLYYVSAMAGLNRPLKPSSFSELQDFSLDLFGLSKQQIADSPAVVFEADIIYPGEDPNIAIFINESGEQLIVANLNWLYATLLKLSDLIWSGMTDVNGWLKRGPIAKNNTRNIEQFVMHNAEFAFAAYQTTLEFALKNTVPLALDI